MAYSIACVCLFFGCNKIKFVFAKMKVEYTLGSAGKVSVSDKLKLELRIIAKNSELYLCFLDWPKKKSYPSFV